MTRFAIIAATTALLTAPAFAQSTTEVAEEIINQSEDSTLEQIDATPVMGEEECMNPTVENENESEDMVLAREDCVTDVEADEVHEELEADDDEGVGTDG